MADDSVGRRSLSPNLIAGLVLAVFAIALVLWQQPWQHGREAVPAAVPSNSTVAANSIAAQIHDLARAKTRDDFVAAAGDSEAGRAWAGQTYDNITALGATDIALTFVSGGGVAVRTGGTEATVSVSWRPGPESGLSEVQTQESLVTFQLDRLAGDAFAVRGVVHDQGPMPLWLAGSLDVQRSEGATVISVDGGNTDKPISDAAEKAHQTVRKVVTSAIARLVVISPHTQDQAAELIDQKPQAISQLAAVTTTLDGSTQADAATMIMLNPAVFATMDDRAAQIVMSHEATHMMTKAGNSGLETWVSEGFADYVALHDDTAPLSVSAGQILRSVKADGVPKALPTSADFGAQQHGLGGTYESAWMIFRMLGATYGDEAVLSFYNEALRGDSTAKAAQTAFGLSIAQITTAWQNYLEVKSASITS